MMADRNGLLGRFLVAGNGHVGDFLGLCLADFRRRLSLRASTSARTSIAEPNHAPIRAKQAVLMRGLGAHRHPVSTNNPQAQRFFDQGFTLVFAFNHEEAVRSFRRAAERAFRADLETYPRSMRSLVGLHAILQAQGKDYAAGWVKKELEAARKEAGSRIEMESR